ncbi:MAG: O-antigen ligase family protein [Vicinamibacterales bacterium]
MSVRPVPAMTWRPRKAATPLPFPRRQAEAVARPEPEPLVAADDEPSLRWPFWFVMLYFVVDFGRPQDWVPPLGALRPGMIVLGGGLLALWLRRHEIVIPPRAQLIFAFLALMALGTPLATNRYWAAIQTKDLALFIFGAVLPLMNFVETTDRMRRLVNWVVLIHIPLAVYCLTHRGFGIGSFLGDENDFCLALNVILPYTFFSLYVAKTTRHKLYLVSTLGLLLFTITATMSRGGFVGVVAVAIACWLVSPRKIASLAGIAVLAISVLSFVPQSYWDEMKTIETSTENDDTGAQRLYLWGMGWEMFKDNPVFGVGPTNFQWNSFKYESPEQSAKGLHVWGKGAHSLYFTLLPEMGVVGVGIFVAILIAGIRENLRIRRTYRRLVKQRAPAELLERLYPLTVYSRANDVAVLAYLVTGAFLSVLYYPYFWLQAGFGVAIVRIFDRILKQQPHVATTSAVAFQTPTVPTLWRA